MSPGEAFKAQVALNATLTGLLTGGVRPSAVPQRGETHVLTYRWVGGREDQTHDGPCGIVYSRLELTVWDTSKLYCDKVANLLRSTFGSWNGTMGGGSGVKMACGGITSPRDLYDGPSGLYATQVDLLMGIDQSTVSYT